MACAVSERAEQTNYHTQDRTQHTHRRRALEVQCYPLIGNEHDDQVQPDTEARSEARCVYPGEAVPHVRARQHDEPIAELQDQQQPRNTHGRDTQLFGISPDYSNKPEKHHNDDP